MFHQHYAEQNVNRVVVLLKVVFLSYYPQCKLKKPHPNKYWNMNLVYMELRKEDTLL